MSGATPTNFGGGGAVAERISKRFGTERAVTALRGISLRAEPGHCTAVLGSSGAGKSVLLRCLAGLERPTEGAVRVGGTDLGRLGEVELTEFRRDRIGVVYQHGNLLPELTAEDNLLLPFDISGRRPDRSRLDRVLDALEVRELLERRPHQLAGPEQQRVALARVLVQRADVLLADEPTGALDAVTARHMLRVLRRCTDEFGQTVVLFSAHPRSAAYADRIVTLDDGRVTKEWEPAAGCRCAQAEAATDHIA